MIQKGPLPFLLVVHPVRHSLPEVLAFLPFLPRDGEHHALRLFHEIVPVKDHGGVLHGFHHVDRHILFQKCRRLLPGHRQEIAPIHQIVQRQGSIGQRVLVQCGVPQRRILLGKMLPQLVHTVPALALDHVNGGLDSLVGGVPQPVPHFYGGKLYGKCADFLRFADMLHSIRHGAGFQLPAVELGHIVLCIEGVIPAAVAGLDVEVYGIVQQIHSFLPIRTRDFWRLRLTKLEGLPGKQKFRGLVKLCQHPDTQSVILRKIFLGKIPRVQHLSLGTCISAPGYQVEHLLIVGNMKQGFVVVHVVAAIVIVIPPS